MRMAIMATNIHCKWQNVDFIIIISLSSVSLRVVHNTHQCMNNYLRVRLTSVKIQEKF